MQCAHIGPIFQATVVYCIAAIYLFLWRINRVYHQGGGLSKFSGIKLSRERERERGIIRPETDMEQQQTILVLLYVTEEKNCHFLIIKVKIMFDKVTLSSIRFAKPHFI